MHSGLHCSQLILRKISKFDATRCQILMPARRRGEGAGSEEERRVEGICRTNVRLLRARLWMIGGLHEWTVS